MSYQETANGLIKAAIGITGTGLSVLIDNASASVSILAGLATALFMFQQFLNAKRKGKAFKDEQDKKNES